MPQTRLTEYHRKRDFAKTPEPRGDASARAGQGGRFVVQLHHASRRHFDFRLQMGETLRSWAVPKGPSLDPGVKRLAVEVEDHPLDYARFEGDIPPGHYGAGHVDIWDSGHWVPEYDPAEGLAKGHLKFTLKGERLRGQWSLIRTGYQGSQPQWLLMKHTDEYVEAGDVADDTPLREWKGAAKHGGSRKVNKGSGKAKTTTSASKAGSRSKATAAASSGHSARVRKLPRLIGLQLARLTDDAPVGPDWLYEVKYDGYRMLAFKQEDDVRIASRNGLDWTDSLPDVVRALQGLKCTSCIVDAELVALDGKGGSDFALLQRRFKSPLGDALRAVVFDLLYLDGEDLRDLPLRTRREKLIALMRRAKPPLAITEYLEGDGPEAFRKACKRGFEGMIAKRLDAPYREGRTGAWLKVKCVQSDEFAVIGYTPGKGARAKLGSLLLARPGEDGKGWIYVGRAGSGLNSDTIDRLLKRLKREERPPALANPPTRAALHGLTPTWVRPEVVVEVAYRGWTRDGLLRQAAVKGLRPDKGIEALREPDQPPRVTTDAIREESPKREAAVRRAGTAATGRRASAGSRRKGTAGSGQARRAARAHGDAADGGGRAAADKVRLTNPDRRLFEDPPITKRELAEFYSAIADYILPGLIDRPLALLRCPDGAENTCFFQKHASPGFSDDIGAVAVSGKDGKTTQHMYVSDLYGLLNLVQMGVLEIHAWGAKVQDIEHPDRLVFDLDPGEGVPWARVLEGARELRERLGRLSLESFVRTTGGKGLHVVVPIEPVTDWDAAKAFSQALARHMEQEAPDKYVANMSKAKRKGRIFVDYLRNGRGATAIVSYSLRARPGAPIATPLRWDELSRLRSPAQYTYSNLQRRLAALSTDPWEALATLKQRLPDYDGVAEKPARPRRRASARAA